MKPYLPVNYISEQCFDSRGYRIVELVKSIIMPFELKEQKGMILHFEAAKVKLKEQEGLILHFGSKPGSATNDCAIHFCKS